MSTLLATWSVKAARGTVSPVLPDGCRDLICLERGTDAPHWFISPLQTGIHAARLRMGDRMSGFRLRPGTVIDEAALLRAMAGRGPDPAATAMRLHDFTRLTQHTTEALACLAEAATVPDAARELGVSTRNLQRLLRGETGQTPGFWRQLARIRAAARQLRPGASLAGIAHEAGFADQAHMSRDFTRWFGVSPRAFAATPRLGAQLAALGYG